MVLARHSAFTPQDFQKMMGLTVGFDTFFDRFFDHMQCSSMRDHLKRRCDLVVPSLQKIIQSWSYQNTCKMQDSSSVLFLATGLDRTRFRTGFQILDLKL